MNPPKTGDLVERHLGPTYRRMHQRAMVTSTTKQGGAWLWVDGRAENHEVATLGTWRSMQCVGDMPPAWIQEGNVYSAREAGVKTVAEIIATRPGWIAFWDHLEGYPEVFRIIDAETFRAHWQPCTNPTAWERIQADLF